jgi:hypothetical protein
MQHCDVTRTAVTAAADKICVLTHSIPLKLACFAHAALQSTVSFAPRGKGAPFDSNTVSVTSLEATLIGNQAVMS